MTKIFTPVSRLCLAALALCLGPLAAFAAPAENNLGLSRRFVSKLNIGHYLDFSQPKYCDSQVVQYSGYLNVGTNDSYFFWFFESRTNPSASPLTVWFNGGPGCSSMVGLFQELGPCRVDSDIKDSYNPFSWNQVSNILFLDQIYPIVYEAFPVYSSLPLHFFGESYAGHYIPSYANYILEQNKAIVASHSSRSKIIPLESVGIGNGWTDPLIQHKYSVTMACNSSYGSVLSESNCTSMANNYPECATLIQKCYDTGSDDDCFKATDYCLYELQYTFFYSGKSGYDVRLEEDIDITTTNYFYFLDDSTVKANIGAKTDYSQCAEVLSRNFAPDVTDLLNSGVRVLIYAGDADYLCNWYGNKAWTDELPFKGSKKYQSKSLRPWKVNGKEVGQVKSASNLSFIRVYDAGHMVPAYQPEAALSMFTTWIKRKSF
ncbi:prepro-carboxypeptidase Z [Phycomyces blakesleeanus]